MNREYLMDYELKEKEELERLLLRKLENGTFSLERDKYPTKERFFKFAEPVAVFTPLLTETNRIWATIPFSGSLVVEIAPVTKSEFEETYFEASMIPEVIDFIKETGRLQVALNFPATSYEGLDYLDPFFTELRPPYLTLAPVTVLGNQKDIGKASEVFSTLASIRYVDYLRTSSRSRTLFLEMLNRDMYTYVCLKLGNHALVEYIENLLVDCPRLAELAIGICKNFVTDPAREVFSGLTNYSREAVNLSRVLPEDERPKEIRFPYEIGKFLMENKLTFAPYGLEACKDIIYHYEAYDLQKVQNALNDGIVQNRPDIASKSAKDLLEILDNVWNDKTIPKRIKNIEIGVPVSIAAIGGIVAGLSGLVAGGFLSELGFRVIEKATEKYAEKLFGVRGEGLAERIGKMRSKSYQINIYDFKKKYKGKIAE
jgi:hypothetical protein